MTLEQWNANGWLKPHEITVEEMTRLLTAARSDLADARVDISPAWRFAIAYNAALRLCTLALAVAGYRAARDQKHYRTIAALPLIVGDDARELTQFLDTCRTKRHDVTYEGLDAISESEATELVDAVGELESLILSWLRRRHPKFASR